MIGYEGDGDEDEDGHGDGWCYDGYWCWEYLLFVIVCWL